MIQDAHVVSLERVDVRWELYIQNIAKHYFKEMRMVFSIQKTRSFTYFQVLIFIVQDQSWC